MKKLMRREFPEVGGVCGGLADYFGIDENIIRILFIICIFLPVPIIMIYLIMWIILPRIKTIT